MSVINNHREVANILLIFTPRFDSILGVRMVLNPLPCLINQPAVLYSIIKCCLYPRREDGVNPFTVSVIKNHREVANILLIFTPRFDSILGVRMVLIPLPCL
jgi:hypothetical protein